MTITTFVYVHHFICIYTQSTPPLSGGVGLGCMDHDDAQWYPTTVYTATLTVTFHSENALVSTKTDSSSLIVDDCSD